MRPRLILFCLLLLTCTPASAQILFFENFDYPATNGLQSHGWVNFGSSGNDVFVSSQGLSYTNYQNSGVGNAAHVTGDEEDVRRIYSPGVSSGSAYISFMVNVADAVSATTDFRFVLALGQNGSTALWGRFWALKNVSDQVAFAIQHLNDSPIITGFNYSLATTYLMVIKYTFIDSEDDEVSLFVLEDPNLPGSEPVTPTAGPATSGQTEPVQIDQIILRQQAVENDFLIDGIRVGLSWGTGAPLPVELNAFTYSVIDNNVSLNWTTISETDNFGFEIERQASPQHWENIRFVAGNGTTSERHDYSYVDAGLTPGEYRYRLKQIDSDGSFEYSQVLSVAVSGPETIELSHNYPNPFNPNTRIDYTLKQPGHVALQIFDLKGGLVKTLVDEQMPSGDHFVNWNGRDGNGRSIASGTYTYVFKVDGRRVSAKTMSLIK